MHITTKKIIATTIMVVLSIPVSGVSALTNKETFLSSLEALHTSITKSVSEREKLLADRAADFGTQYDNALRAQWYSLDEIDALTRMSKLNAPNFRKDISDAYLAQKSAIFSDIRSSDVTLLSLRDEVSLWYGDLSNAQKQSYDAKLAEYQAKYTAFLSGSTLSLDAFSATFSGKLATTLSWVSSMMKQNVDYIRFIAALRNEFALLDQSKEKFVAQNTILETLTLPRLQGEIAALATDKKMATALIRSNLEEGLTKALAQDRLKKQETELRAYLESIMTRWSEYLKTAYAQDETFLLQSLESKNLIQSDTALRARVYESNGDIRSLDATKDSDLLALAKKMNSDFAAAAINTEKLNAQYGSGNTLSSLRSDFRSAQEKKIKGYQDDFQSLLETRLNTALLAETNHAQNFQVIDAEEKLLASNLAGVTSYDFSKKLVDTFIAKLDTIASKDGAEDIKKRVENLKHKYRRLALQKRIEDGSFSAYYSSRIKLDTTMGSFIDTYAARLWSAETARARLAWVADKIESLVNAGKISAKKQYQLLVLRSNILKYLENATK